LFLQEIRQAAEFLDLPELLVFVSNIQSHEEFLNTDLKQQYRKVRMLTCRDNWVHQNQIKYINT
jgi:Rho-related BTB domain-containing protein 1/2